MTTKTDEQQRAAFESWASNDDVQMFIDRSHHDQDLYSHAETNDAWAAWQAAIELDRQGRGAPATLPSDDDIDIEDVRLYLSQWGCLEHPGVRTLLARYGAAQPAETNPTLPYEQALSCLIDKIIPGLDSGDILADAKTASAVVSAIEPVKVLTDEEIFKELTAHGGKTTINTVNAVRAVLSRYGAAQPSVPTHGLQRAIEAYQIVEQECAQRHADSGNLIEPGIAVEAGLLAAAPFLAAQPSVPDGEPMRIALSEQFRRHPQTRALIGREALVLRCVRAAMLEAAPTPPADEQAQQEQETCETCQGNGEIVTDWERYKHPHGGDKGDEAVAECPDCDGQGTVEPAQQDAGRVDAERYRWVRQHWGRIDDTYVGDTGRIIEVRVNDDNEGWDTDPDSLDAAIDAARAQQGGQS